MLVSPAALMADAQQRGYAIPAFNFYNLDILFAALEAAEEERAPVILEIYHVYYPFLHQTCIAAAALEALRTSSVRCYLHLDHATEAPVLRAAIRDGFSSVMADGSALSLEENIAFTREITALARAQGVYTEAEVGHIAKAGALADAPALAAVEDCVRLVEETGVDSLAAAVGTSHGMYKAPPKVDFDRIRAIRSAVNVPLVLHGGSGTPDEAIREAIRCGIAKINVGTELKYAWSETMRAGLATGEKEPRILSAAARDAVREIARRKLRLFGASGKENP